MVWCVYFHTEPSICTCSILLGDGMVCLSPYRVSAEISDHFVIFDTICSLVRIQKSAADGWLKVHAGLCNIIQCYRLHAMKVSNTYTILLV